MATRPVSKSGPGPNAESPWNFFAIPSLGKSRVAQPFIILQQ